MLLIDVNVLVYAFREDAPRHDDYRGWLLETIGSGKPFGVADIVLSGFLRITTHPHHDSSTHLQACKPDPPTFAGAIR